MVTFREFRNPQKSSVMIYGIVLVGEQLSCSGRTYSRRNSVTLLKKLLLVEKELGVVSDVTECNKINSRNRINRLNR